MSTISKARRILDRLVENNMFYDMLMSNRERTATGHWRPAGKPGQAIQQLSPEEREELMKLTPEEIANVRAIPTMQKLTPEQIHEQKLYEQKQKRKR
jgi:hypothetical protein